jgi:hypothetical protein
MVRAESGLLDGYETAAVSGGMIEDDRWSADNKPLTVFSENPRVFAFARALPGQANAPVVVHLVDWSGDPQACTVSLNPNTLFGGRPLDISLVMPKPYDRDDHRAAVETGEYGALVQKLRLARGHVTTCQLPPLRPWAMLVVRPLLDQSGRWPPRFVSVPDQETTMVGMASPDPEATIRFTTDGSRPNKESPAYQAPIPVDAGSEIRAFCDHDGGVSSESVLKHFPAAHLQPRPLLVNGDFSSGTDGWRRVVSGELGDHDALQFDVGKNPQLENRIAARLHVNASDGVPYHLRLVQPLQIPEQANLYVTATLQSNRPTRVRFGIQEQVAPYRVVQLDVLELDSEPRHVRWNATNPFSDLEAQLQLEFGYCDAGTTVWASDIAVHDLRTCQ